MTIKNKALLVLIGMVVLLLISCTSMGQQMPIMPDENVIGTIQVFFTARESWFSNNDHINMQVYIKLLEAAVIKYSGEIDLRDIVWVSGRTVSLGNVEVSATAKVIEVKKHEANI